MMFSVIIPTIEAKQEWIAKALSSCLFADEIIITRERGLSQAVNNAVNLARGEWVSILPDDDFYLPEIGEAVYIAMKSLADVVYFPCKHWAEEVPLEGLHDTDKDGTIYGSCFMRRDSFLRAGGYDGGTKCMDARLFDRMKKMGMKFEYVPVAGGVFRWNSHSKLQGSYFGCSRMIGGGID
jgi:glycosyltransferase involved in cell wall biosynthesis